MKRRLLGLVVVVAVAAMAVPTAEAGMNFDEMFMRGDCNSDGTIDMSDPTALGNYLYAGGTAPPCLSTCDANADGAVNGSDQIFLYNYLFSGGSPPYGAVPCD